jgi:hypothetical protein
MFLIIISYFFEKHSPFGFRNIVSVHNWEVVTEYLKVIQMNLLLCGCAVAQALNCQPCHRDLSSLLGQSEICGV